MLGFRPPIHFDLAEGSYLVLCLSKLHETRPLAKLSTALPCEAETEEAEAKAPLRHVQSSALPLSMYAWALEGCASLLVASNVDATNLPGKPWGCVGS